MTVRCMVCATDFEAHRKNARYCGDACRQRSRRRTKASEPVAGDSPLVAEVRRDLARAKKLNTVDGQAALLLAAQGSAPGAIGIAAIKELRKVLEVVLVGLPRGGAVEGTAPEKPTEPEPEDEVQKARRKRERKGGQAAAR